MGITTAYEIVSLWKNRMALRAGTEEADRLNYEARRKHYAADPGFDGYQALSAYLDAMDFEPFEYASDADRLLAYQGTFGRPGEALDDLQTRLDGHFAAMSAAYDAELAVALNGVEP